MGSMIAILKSTAAIVFLKSLNPNGRSYPTITRVSGTAELAIIDMASIMAAAAGIFSIALLYPVIDTMIPRNMLIASGDFIMFFNIAGMLLLSVALTLQLTVLRKAISAVKMNREFPTSRMASLYKFSAPK